MVTKDLLERKGQIVGKLQFSEWSGRARDGALALGAYGLRRLSIGIQQTAKNALSYGGTINLQRVLLQTGIYCLVIGLAVGLTAAGSKIMFGLIHHEMSERGAEIAFTNLPTEIETASIRPSIR